ncbi:MaoC family dehydratase [Peterkaempfera bronchialis]|uniref:Enoyl-CoA hydratase n=1 Tax=Peterkaempfera bronchialis TaxID=2126346 RepID=A0A345SRD4_9ACTN|nr:MaoC family dehydratase [Peterkaempfera bronchialis]AXI76289.1 hypothetical protein C7M71_001145 [Peterkaempfera bronchialis]
MALDFSIVGSATEPHPVTWTSDQALLYAVGVGAGTDESIDELAFTTENTRSVPQSVLPTFPVVLGYGAPRLSYGDIDLTRMVHAFQSVEITGPLAPEGSGFYSSTVTGIHDKGSGALITTESLLTGPDGSPLARMSGGAFLRGEGGFGGDRGPSTTWAAPDREPDVVVEQRTVPWQALLYRLSGDRNPLHSDPAFAVAGGFPRPILHGLCTYGFVGRAILHAAAGSDPARFRSMSARFSAPVLPGDTLSTALWLEDGEVLFATRTQDGTSVLSQGRAVVEPEGAR